MFRRVEPYLDPIDIFDKIGERKSELSNENLGFICGLIKERKPQKIVELGVSAGGTSCVILNCFEKLNMDSKLYSVDLSYTYHLDNSKRCGYQIMDAAKYLSNMGNHTLILGKNIAEVIDDEIGNEIDLLILDTIHYLPGELLDFLVCMPYLSKRAVIVLDDLTFAHWGENTNAIATKVLYDLIVGDKVFPMDDSAIPKMAGVVLSDDTWKYKLDYFLGLSLPWWYKLELCEVEAYRNIIEKRYGTDELVLFDEAVRLNTETLNKKFKIRGEIEKVLNICMEGGREILIYGAGQRGTALGKFIKDYVGKDVSYVVSDDRKKDQFEKGRIYNLYEIVKSKDKYRIFVAVADAEVRDNLKKYDIDYIDVPNYCFPFIREYTSLLPLKMKN